MTIRRLAACIAATALLLSSCSNVDLFRNEEADRAKQRWGSARAKVKLQLAEKSFASGAVDEALKQCNEVLTLDSELPGAYLLAARIRLERGEVGKAQTAVDSAEMAALPSAESNYLRGLIEERKGRPAEALEHYRTAYCMNPEELDYLLTYVECLIATDQHERAIETIAPRRVDFEQTPAVHALAGQAYSLMGRHTRAAECYQFALQLAPDDPLLGEEAGAAFLAAGWDDEAADALRPLVDPKPTTQPSAGQPIPSLAALQGLATALLRSGKSDRAADLLERSVRHYADQAAIWLLLAEAHIRSNDLESAERAAQRAIEIAPDDPDGQLALAYCALRTNRADKAIDVAQRLIRRNPKDVEARAVLARALEQTPGRSADAADQYRQILTIRPDNRWAREQLQRLTRQAKAGA
jgi:tetratricopeptide (TPR) repeat protein